MASPCATRVCFVRDRWSAPIATSSVIATLPSAYPSPIPTRRPCPPICVPLDDHLRRTPLHGHPNEIEFEKPLIRPSAPTAPSPPLFPQGRALEQPHVGRILPPPPAPRAAPAALRTLLRGPCPNPSAAQPAAESR